MITRERDARSAGESKSPKLYRTARLLQKAFPSAEIRIVTDVFDAYYLQTDYTLIHVRYKGYDCAYYATHGIDEWKLKEWIFHQLKYL